ncbi:uncharacterized protein (TIGR03083 family) [Spinactinospora alkalitolerans]|uniref:Uncharacterized protein (TIGR03083 family) n=1 Tax=Spinactinospora alkalitolerans TaxID=687207 RepID=A0A852U261_9ACTN|nr:maleylpyruvate isomerase family mycothiol-dependent enzyme [Spinactinospora alkalitolerans]NYE50308.1 uncharacterized protein (TIGR03083 family) [Spinactinospora alkalitolerans]
MQRHDHIRFLDAEGERMAEAAERAGLDAEVPTCPGWRVRDLLRHTGGVHRWATEIVGAPCARPPGGQRTRELMESWPEDDAGLLGWFAEGHRRLVEILDAAPQDTECWSFLPAPSPVAFWARRQAHETTVHRLDAEAAAGAAAAAPVPADLAADGIEELLTGFFARRDGRITADPARTLAVRAADTGHHWPVTVAPHGVDVAPHPDAAECTVSGPAADLYALLWNRADGDGLAVAGDPAVLTFWRDRAHVTWG